MPGLPPRARCSTLHPILEQIEDYAAQTGLPAPVFAAAKEVFDKALADGWGDLDIACVHDQMSGVSASRSPHDLVAGQLYRHGTAGFGVLREDGTLVAPTELKRWSSPLELLEDWPAAEAVLRDLNPAEAPAGEYDALLPPLQWPRKVICAGVNYRKHMREMGGEIPETGWRPFFFLKAPTTSVIGPRDPIVISSPARARYDWEAELAVVIGIKGKNIIPNGPGLTSRPTACPTT